MGNRSPKVLYFAIGIYNMEKQASGFWRKILKQKNGPNFFVVHTIQNQLLLRKGKNLYFDVQNVKILKTWQSDFGKSPDIVPVLARDSK